MSAATATDRMAYSVTDAARTLGVSRSRLYELLAGGQLQAKKEGRRTLIPRDSLVEFLDGLPDARFTGEQAQ